MIKKVIVLFAMIFALQPNAIAFAVDSGGTSSGSTTPAPTKSATPVATPTPVATATPTPVVTPTPVATPTPVTSATPAPVATPTPQASATPTPQASVAPSKEFLLAASMVKARELIAGKNWQAAISELLIAQKLEAKNADALNLLGFSHRKIGDFTTSLTYYKAALRIDPKHKGAHEYLGELYLMMKDPKKAAAELATLKRICGITCEEYLDLAGAIKKAKK